MSADTGGLRGVAVADTSLSRVDGEKGELIYRGYDIRDLGKHATFEEVVYLLWDGVLPTAEQLAGFNASLAERRALPAGVLALLRQFPREAQPMDVLRTVVSALGFYDPATDDVRPAGARAKALGLIAVLPTIVAAWERIRHGREPLAPRPDLGHAANFLYLLTGAEPGREAVRALDAYLVMTADHDFNASTFAARVTIGTLTDIYSAVTSAIGTLKGPRHGGANQKAMEQFLEAEASGDVAGWYRQARSERRLIMGIGHPVYRVEDPRARIFRPLAEQLARSGGEAKWFDVAAEIDRLARSDPYFVERNLHANVDYYSAVVLYMLGLPVDQFTCIFAMSRVAGWTAHIQEQLADNRLIRPAANYVGPDGLDYVPLDAR